MMIANISTIQNRKNIPTRGTDSLDSGIVSAIRSMNTVVANINVTETDNLSPDSAGRINVVIVRSVIRTMGKIKLRM